MKLEERLSKTKKLLAEVLQRIEALEKMNDMSAIPLPTPANFPFNILYQNKVITMLNMNQLHFYHPHSQSQVAPANQHQPSPTTAFNIKHQKALIIHTHQRQATMNITYGLLIIPSYHQQLPLTINI